MVLVKNEDLNIRRVLNNILDFCDTIYACDNYSKDRTWSLIRGEADRHQKIEPHRIRKTRQSHDFIKGYAGTHTWIFAVDGDEIYDPAGLQRFREQLFQGRYDFTFSMYGHTLNCLSIDERQGTARGYLTPAAKSVTKLYNFNAITRWDQVPAERLHAGEIDFKPGYHYNMKHPYMNEIGWEEAAFRCLHTCFMRRSSLEPEGQAVYARENIYDKNGAIVPKALPFRILNDLRRAMSIKRLDSSWKLAKYAQGDLVEKEIGAFFPPLPPSSTEEG